MVDTIQGFGVWVPGKAGVDLALPGQGKQRGKAEPARQRVTKTRRDIMFELSTIREEALYRIKLFFFVSGETKSRVYPNSARNRT
jgi:hypothetical protein